MKSGAARARLFLLPALAALAVAVPALNGRLLWDDQLLILRDPFVHSLGNAGSVFARSFWAGQPAGTQTHDYFRPLTTLSYMLTWQFAGEAPWAYHAFNALVYAGTAGLLAWAVAAAGAGEGVALAAGVLFAVYPPHHENVDFISGRTDLLAGLFLVLAFLARLRLGDPKRRRAADLWLMAAWVACAALSKEIAYAAPACLLLYEWAEGWKPGWGARLAAAAVPVALVAAAQRAVLASHAPAPLPHVSTMLTALLLHTRNLLAPWPVHVNRYLPPGVAGAPPAVLAAWAAFVVATVAFASGRAERAAWLCLWGLLLPACLVGIPADRFVYLPSMLFVALVAWKLSRLPWGRRARMALCLGAALAGGAGLAAAGSLWSGGQRFYAAQIAESPWDPGPRQNIAEAYREAASGPGVADTTRLRLMRQMVAQLDTCTALDPTRAGAWESLGRTLCALGEDSAGLAALERSLQLAENEEVRSVEAQVLARMGRLEEAEVASGRSLVSEAGRADAGRWATLGWIRLRRGRALGAVEAADEALRREPGLRYAAYDRALALGAAGRLGEARAAYAGLLRGETDIQPVINALGGIDDFAREHPAAGEAVGRAFLEAAGLLPAGDAALAPAMRPVVKEALLRCPSLAGIRVP